MIQSTKEDATKRATAITCVFADIGGVLLTNGWDHHARRRAAKRFKLAWAEMEDRHQLNFATYEEGKLTLEDYLDRVVFFQKRQFTHAEFQRFMFAQSKPYHSIVDLEEHLHRNGTRVVKFFLHLSKEEQRKRFLDRIGEPDKNWKFSLADIHERKYWPRYMQAYEACLSATSTATAPGYVVPADDKKNARLIVSKIVLDAFNELEMAYPRTSAKRRSELKSIRKLLQEEKL